MINRKATAPAMGAGAANDNVTREQFRYSAQSTDAQALAVYHLARRLAGDGNADRDTIQAAYPDAPVEDLDALRDWLKGHPNVVEVVARTNPEDPPPDASPLSLLTADAILTTDWPEPVWAIPGLLPAGLTILAGKPKVGKSWLSLQIAQAVAAGGVALGEQVEAGPILYLALEDPPRRLKDRMLKQHWPPGLPAEFMPLGEFAGQIGDLRNGGGEVLARQIGSRGYRLVTIDTLSRAVRGDYADMDEMTDALAPIQEMAHVHNCAAVLVDHHRKGFGTAPDAVGDILGSTAKGATPDCIWGLYREPGKAGAKLAITGRDVEEQTLALRFDPLTGCWQCEGDADELELTERWQEILDALRGMGPTRITDLARAIDQDKGSTYKRLQDLVNAGRVIRKGNRYALPHT
jgi:hypothetical protein